MNKSRKMKIFINDVIYLSMCYHLHWKNQREFQTDISHDETGTYVSDVNGSEWSLKLSYSLMSRRTALSSQSYVSSSCSIVTQDIDLIRTLSITSLWPPPLSQKINKKYLMNMTLLNRVTCQSFTPFIYSQLENSNEISDV